MRESEKKEVFEAAIERMVDEAVAKVQPEHPVPYARKVRSDLRDRHYPMARDLFAEHETLTCDELFGLLYAADHPAVIPSAPTVRMHTDKNCCPECGCYGGGGWLTSPDRDDIGMIPDLVPCPVCAIDRHRLHARSFVTEDRVDLHRQVAATIERQRESRA